MTLSFLVLFFMILSLARLQGEGEKIELPNRGGLILLMLDISHSMLVEDVKPNRLEFMKRELSRLIDLSSGDRIALAFFANSAVLACPFTTDLSAVKSYLNDLSTDYLSHQGTDFERAFDLVAQVFEQKKAPAVKVVVIASDGEDHSKKTKDRIKTLLKEKGLRIFTLSFGTEKGAVIPLRDYKNQIKEYKKDIKGNLVTSRLNPVFLRQFARWGKGSYYHVNYGNSAIEKLRKDLDLLKKTDFDKESSTKTKEYYQWFLLLAFFIAFIELILTDRKKI